jgi:hypothetical protein
LENVHRKNFNKRYTDLESRQMGKQTFDKMKKILSILLAVCFLMSVTAVAVSAHQEAVKVWEPAHWEPAHWVAAGFNDDGDWIPAHWVEAGWVEGKMVWKMIEVNDHHKPGPDHHKPAHDHHKPAPVHQNPRPHHP